MQQIILTLPLLKALSIGTHNSVGENDGLRDLGEHLTRLEGLAISAHNNLGQNGLKHIFKAATLEDLTIGTPNSFGNGSDQFRGVQTKLPNLYSLTIGTAGAIRFKSRQPPLPEIPSRFLPPPRPRTDLDELERIGAQFRQFQEQRRRQEELRTNPEAARAARRRAEDNALRKGALA